MKIISTLLFVITVSGTAFAQTNRQVSSFEFNGKLAQAMQALIEASPEKVEVSRNNSATKVPMEFLGANIKAYELGFPISCFYPDESCASKPENSCTLVSDTSVRPPEAIVPPHVKTEILNDRTRVRLFYTQEALLLSIWLERLVEKRLPDGLSVTSSMNWPSGNVKVGTKSVRLSGGGRDNDLLIECQKSFSTKQDSGGDVTVQWIGSWYCSLNL